MWSFGVNRIDDFQEVGFIEVDVPGVGCIAFLQIVCRRISLLCSVSFVRLLQAFFTLKSTTWDIVFTHESWSAKVFTFQHSVEFNLIKLALRFCKSLEIPLLSFMWAKRFFFIVMHPIFEFSRNKSLFKLFFWLTITFLDFAHIVLFEFEPFPGKLIKLLFFIVLMLYLVPFLIIHFIIGVWVTWYFYFWLFMATFMMVTLFCIPGINTVFNAYSFRVGGFPSHYFFVGLACVWIMPFSSLIGNLLCLNFLLFLLFALRNCLDALIVGEYLIGHCELVNFGRFGFDPHLFFLDDLGIQMSNVFLSLLLSSPEVFELFLVLNLSYILLLDHFLEFLDLLQFWSFRRCHFFEFFRQTLVLFFASLQGLHKVPNFGFFFWAKVSERYPIGWEMMMLSLRMLLCQVLIIIDEFGAPELLGTSRLVRSFEHCISN